MRVRVRGAVLSAMCVATVAALQASAFGGQRPLFASDTRSAADSVVVPAWLYPSAPPTTVTPVWDSITPIHLPRVHVAFTASKLHDLYTAPDWTPATHPVMPEVVARGRKPALFACAYCHMPDGRGRPENVPLAGLPAAYIMRQVADLKSHARTSAWKNGPWVPYDNMLKVAEAATESEVAAAAAYFAQLTPRQRTRIVEVSSIPRVRQGLGLWLVEPGRDSEPLSQRVIEVPLDNARHDLRDPNLGYVGYVPVGSIARGRAVATRAVNDAQQVCASCHGPMLRGAGDVPPLAGVSPGYIVRQLLAFRSGARSTAVSAPMLVVARTLSLEDMIAVAAYAATLRR
jgi:cytochrome c553